MKINFTPVKLVSFLFIFSAITFITACTALQRQTHEHWRDKDRGSYDRPGKADPDEGVAKTRTIKQAMEFEYLKTKSPLTGSVPKYKLLEAFKLADAYKKSSGILLQGLSTPLTWSERGPSSIGGRTRAILPDLNDATQKTVWAGSVSGGLWKTTDITAASPVWSHQNDFFNNLAITAIVQNSTSPNILYFGTGEGFTAVDNLLGDGIWKSTDGGKTWNQLPSTAVSLTQTSFTTISNLTDYTVGGKEYLFAATQSMGIMRSLDGGTTWQSVLSNANGNALAKGAADVTLAADGSVYAAMGMAADQITDGIYKSTNNGNTWVKLTAGLPSSGFYRIKLAAAPSNGARVFAVIQDAASDGCKGIYRTDNNGSTWKAVTNPSVFSVYDQKNVNFAGNQADYALAAGVDPSNPNHIIVGGLNMAASTDGGVTWAQVSNGDGGGQIAPDVHVDHHAIVFDPRNGNHAFFGNDGGIYYSSNATVLTPAIASKNTGYNVTQFYHGAITPVLGKEDYLGGTQDNGCITLTSAGISPGVEVPTGDGGFVHIDADQPNIQIVAGTNSQYHISTDYSVTETDITFGDQTNTVGQFTNPTDYDSRDNTLYGADNGGNYHIIQNVGTKNTQVVITAGLSDVISAVRVSPNTAKRVFFATQVGNIYMVDNASSTSPAVKKIDAPNLPASAYVSCIAVQQGNDQHLLVTYSNYDIAHVWETKNGGATWTNLTGNLPNMPVRSVCFKPFSSTAAVIATELGVWNANLNGTATIWQEANTGLARVRTDWVDFRPTDGSLFAATFGRGLFSSTTFAQIPIQFVDASYKINKTDAATGTACKMYKDIIVPIQLLENITGTATVKILPTSRLTLGVDYDVLNGGLVNFTTAGTQNATIRVYNTANNNLLDTITLGLSITNPNTTNAAITSNTALANRAIVINNNNNPGPFATGKAQVDYGTATDPNTPFSGDWDGVKLRNLYLASELKAAGLVAGQPINALAWNIASKSSTQPFVAFTIKIANVSASVLKAYTDGTGFVTVFSADYSIKTGINTFKFSVPFVWDGVSNIIIETCFDNSTSPGNPAVAPDLVTGVKGKVNRDYFSSVSGSSGCAINAPNANSASDGFLPTVYFIQNSVMPVQVASNKGITQPKAIYGNRTVYFYGDNLGTKITGSLTNNNAVALGCTNLQVDRQGNSSNTVFNSFTISNFLASKTFLLTDSSASVGKVAYNLALYYSRTEIAKWMQQSGKAIKDLRVVQVLGMTVSKVTPTSTFKSSVRIFTPTITNYNDTGYIVTVALDTMATISGFGVGAVVPSTTVSINLNGGTNNGVTQLNWATINEADNAAFDVERSTDGIAFSPIGHVTGKAFDNNYGYQDVTAQQKNYYRIKLTTPGAEDVYTDTVLVSSDMAGNMVAIQPNPFASTINIRFATGLHGMALITMYDISGRKVYEGKHMAYGFATINPGHIGAGSYLVTVLINNKLYNIRAIKQ